MPKIFVAGLALALVLVGAGSAAASWTRFCPPAADSANARMGVARTADGPLHFVWVAGAATSGYAPAALVLRVH